MSTAVVNAAAAAALSHRKSQMMTMNEKIPNEKSLIDQIQVKAQQQQQPRAEV